MLVEAMACGTPVLAFAGGAVEEIVADGINGWICRDVDDMAQRIGSPDIDAAACRSFVDTNFSVATMADRYVDVYECATSTPRSTIEVEA